MVRAVAEACDVFEFPPSKVQTGVYAYGLKTGEVRQSSDYVEPMVMLHANVAVIAEVCFGARRQYAVHLYRGGRSERRRYSHTVRGTRDA